MLICIAIWRLKYSCPDIQAILQIYVRFLVKKNSIASVLKIYGPLQQYFTSNPSKKVHKTLKKIFADPINKIYLIVVRELCEVFEQTIIKIEGNETMKPSKLLTVYLIHLRQ